MKELGLVDINVGDMVNIIDGYIGLGYGKSTKQELGESYDYMYTFWLLNFGLTFQD